MTFNQKTLLRFLSFLLVISVASAEQAPEDKVVRTGGIYLSEVQTNTEGTAYTSELLFAPDGRVFLAHHAVKIPLERLCKMLIPELDNWKWSRATSYRLEGNRLAFQTTSLNATSTFNGTIESGVLKMQLVVPTKNNLTYPLTFKFASCS